MSNLLVVEKVKAVEVFGGGGLNSLLKKIRHEAKSVVTDVTTATGRRDIASMAAKVSKSKTYLDSLGKDLVADWKQKSKLVDSDRKIMRDTLDELKAEVRQPLTDWENIEKDRVDKHENKMSLILSAGADAVECWMTTPLSVLNKSLADIEKTVIDKTWEEFEDQAQITKDISIKNLSTAIVLLTKHEAEQEELQKLRAEKELRIKQDEEKELKIELESRAKRDAEKALEVERNKARKEADAAIKAKAEAVARQRAAEVNAKREIELADERARSKLANEQAFIAAEKKKREEDDALISKVHNHIYAAMTGLGIDAKDAVMLIKAISEDKVPNVFITY